MQLKPLILIVDDEKPIRSFTKVALETHGYRCIEASDGSNAISMISSHLPDVVILDLGLPDIDGLAVIEKVRSWSQIPIIVVSARGSERDKVTALDLGADDFLTKPFGIPELLARLRVTLRRQSPMGKEQNTLKSFAVGDLKIDFVKRLVKLDNKEIHLTPIEYAIIMLLATHAGKVLTHKFILTNVWGSASVDNTQTLRVTMGNIRRKIETSPAQPRYIATEVGVGYRLMDE